MVGNVTVMPNMLVISRSDARLMTFAVTKAIQPMYRQIEAGKASSSEKKLAQSLREGRRRVRYALDGDPADAPDAPWPASDE